MIHYNIFIIILSLNHYLIPLTSFYEFMVFKRPLEVFEIVNSLTFGSEGKSYLPTSAPCFPKKYLSWPCSCSLSFWNFEDHFPIYSIRDDEFGRVLWAIEVIFVFEYLPGPGVVSSYFSNFQVYRLPVPIKLYLSLNCFFVSCWYWEGIFSYIFKTLLGM